MSRLFGYTASAVERDAVAIEAFENKKKEAKTNYWFVHIIKLFKPFKTIVYTINKKNYFIIFYMGIFYWDILNPIFTSVFMFIIE